MEPLPEIAYRVTAAEAWKPTINHQIHCRYYPIHVPSCRHISFYTQSKRTEKKGKSGIMREDNPEKLQHKIFFN
jgi:hypothetical protein